MRSGSKLFAQLPCLALSLVALGAAGCRSGHPAAAIGSVPPMIGAVVREASPDLQLATHQEPQSEAEPIQPPMPAPTTENDPPAVLTDGRAEAPAVIDDLFIEAEALDVETLAVLVEQRNPSLAAMYARWQAMAARYPQEIALDDPLVDMMMAPASFASSSNVQSSWAVQASQKFPWHGKREERGAMAGHNAQAANLDVEDARLRLMLASRIAFADYLLAQRAKQLNEAEVQLLTELKTVALTRYETNQSPQQDALQADVELAEARRRSLEAHRAYRVAIARINTLLQRPPLATLPPPSEAEMESVALPTDEELLSLALQQRPDLQAQAERLAAERHSLELALLEFHPDIELYGRYDRMWVDVEQQASVGMELNLPLRKARRRAAVDEARAKVAAAEAEYNASAAQIQFEVQSAAERARESQQVTQLYSDQIISAATLNVSSARAGHEAGAIGFLTLVSAQRQLIDARQRRFEDADR